MIYFNEKKPENMSIYIPYLKDKYVCLVKDGAWTTKQANDVIPTFNEYNYYILKEWVDENKDKIGESTKNRFNEFENAFTKKICKKMHTNYLNHYCMIIVNFLKRQESN